MSDSEADLDVSKVADRLAETDLFKSLPKSQTYRIASLGRVVELSKGDELFAEGTEGKEFYLILSGSVRISRIVGGLGEEALAILEAGDYFGEMALISNETRSATALVHRSGSAFVLGRQEFQDELFIDRDLAYIVLWKLVRTLSSRLRATNDKMTMLATASKF